MPARVIAFESVSALPDEGSPAPVASPADALAVLRVIERIYEAS